MQRHQFSSASRLMEAVATQGNKEVKNLLSFEDCPELLRGSNLYHILRCGAQIFAQSSGDAGTYRLSKPVSHLDVFFSHNWACPRVYKLLCLMLHFNFYPAFCATLAWLALLLMLTLLGWVPLVSTSDETYRSGVLAYFGTAPVFLFLWFCWRDIAPTFGSDLRVFLDKTCIHQEDVNLQQQGIQKLGAFLCSADSVLVCFTPLYLVKLWTVYEAATFLCLKKVERLHVIPVEMPVVLLCMALVFYILNVSSMLLRIFLFWDSFELYIGPIFLILFCVLCRRMSLMKAQLRTTLETFDVTKCECYDERDRPVVYRNIALLMHQRFKLPRDTSIEDALVHFEDLVRTLLPIAFERSFGRNTLPYRYLAMLTFLAYMPRAIDHLACLLDGWSFRYWVHAWLCGYVNLTFWVVPLCFSVGSWVSAQQLRWKGWWDVCWTLVSTLATSLCLVVGYFPVLLCEEAAYDHEPGNDWTEAQDRAFCILIAITVVGSTSGVLMLSGSCRRCARRAPSSAAEKFKRFGSRRTNSFFESPEDGQVHANEALNQVSVAIAVRLASQSVDEYSIGSNAGERLRATFGSDGAGLGRGYASRSNDDSTNNNDNSITNSNTNSIIAHANAENKGSDDHRNVTGSDINPNSSHEPGGSHGSEGCEISRTVSQARQVESGFEISRALVQVANV